jgi:hypothetical protein
MMRIGKIIEDNINNLQSTPKSLLFRGPRWQSTPCRANTGDVNQQHKQHKINNNSVGAQHTPTAQG